MKIYLNERLVNRNKRIGQITTVASLVILAVSLIFSFNANSQLIIFSFLGLILGFVLSQVGIYYGNRYGRRPRPDEAIDTSLKGLDDRYSIYHYVSPVSHLLVGPAGLWIILPYSQGGTITYQKSRWRQKGGNFYLKLFGQEGIGRPDLEVNSMSTDLKKFFERIMPEVGYPPIQALLLFTNEKATVDADEAPTPTLSVKKFKDFIRKCAKDSPIPQDRIAAINDALTQG